jgi:hypothetical protein
MDRVTRCLHCGKRLVPVPSADGRTELKCVWRDEVDPMETEAAKWLTVHWPDQSLPVLREALEGTCPEQAV